MYYKNESKKYGRLLVLFYLSERGEDFFMMSFFGYVGTLVKDVVLSNNQRDFEICHDNNTTKIEIGKLVLGGVTLLGTLALQFYNSHKSNSED